MIEDLPKQYHAGNPYPEAPGPRADLYMEVRELRLTIDKWSEYVKKRESELRESLIRDLEKSRDDGKDTGAAGKKYRVQIKDKEVPRVEDWASFHAFIKKTGRFDLLQKRLSDKAVMDMLDAGEALPGVDTALIPDVSVTKI